MKLDGKTVLVTGGAGFIGSHLVDALRHCTVRVLDDLSTGKEANLGDARKNGRLEFVHGDIRDRGLVAKLLRDVDVVFHLACRGVRHSIGNPLESHLVNAEGTLTLLAEARRAASSGFCTFRRLKCTAQPAAPRWTRITRPFPRPSTAPQSSPEKPTPARITKPMACLRSWSAPSIILDRAAITKGIRARSSHDSLSGR